jgi:hypothetical protein
VDSKYYPARSSGRKSYKYTGDEGSEYEGGYKKL